MIDCYTGATEDSIKEHIVHSFTTPNSPLWIVITAVAIGMGLDCPDVRKIIHIWSPEDVECYLQQTGSAGQNGKDCSAVLFHGKGLSRHIDESMQAYCLNTTVCRRKMLMTLFEDQSIVTDVLPSCACCDVCEKTSSMM